MLRFNYSRRRDEEVRTHTHTPNQREGRSLKGCLKLAGCVWGSNTTKSVAIRNVIFQK